MMSDLVEVRFCVVYNANGTFRLVVLSCLIASRLIMPCLVALRCVLSCLVTSRYVSLRLVTSRCVVVDMHKKM